MNTTGFAGKHISLDDFVCLIKKENVLGAEDKSFLKNLKRTYVSANKAYGNIIKSLASINRLSGKKLSVPQDRIVLYRSGNYKLRSFTKDGIDILLKYRDENNIAIFEKVVNEYIACVRSIDELYREYESIRVEFNIARENGIKSNGKAFLFKGALYPLI